MSNEVFTLLAVTALALHVGAAGLAATHRGTAAAMGLVCAFAAAVLVWMAFHPRPFKPPVDALVVGFAALEAVALIAAALALRGVRIAQRVAWLGFAANATVSVLAVAFVLVFKMDRLF